ncbi:MAG: GIY-YIG nuclease family protein [Bacteroidetes bacterium]|nr:GIY-YIG nuclease family protein [Bacteroidota bacterium]
MVCYVYLLESLVRPYVYVGLSFDVERRVRQHNAGYSKTTAPYRPFKLLLVEAYDDRIQARQREKFLRSGKGREFVRTLRRAQG